MNLSTLLFEADGRCLLHELLVALVPDLAGRVEKLDPELVRELHTDGSLPQKLVQLKEWLPKTDISALVACRPSLLLDQNFNMIPTAMDRLALQFAPEYAEALAAAQPWLLDDRSEEWLQSLQRLLKKDPEALAVALLKDPTLLFAAQSGKNSLGPGAEFMS